MIEVDCRKCVNCTGEECIPLEQALKAEYNKAIDDFVEELIRYVDCGHLCSPTDVRWSDLSVVEMVKKLAEHLKAGASDGNG